MKETQIESSYYLKSSETSDTKLVKLFGNLDQCVAQLKLTDGQYQFTALEELPIGVVDDFLKRARIQLDDGGKLFTVPHQFILLDRREHSFSDGYPFDHPEQVELPHYLVEYMSSSLRWIPTWNYSTTPTPQTGLNLYGTTEIRLNGAETCKGVIEGWLQIFKHAPTQFTVQAPGYVIPWVDDGTEEGAHPEELAYHELLKLDKTMVMNSLEAFSNLLQRLIQKQDDYHFVLHCGL